MALLPIGSPQAQEAGREEAHGGHSAEPRSDRRARKVAGEVRVQVCALIFAPPGLSGQGPGADAVLHGGKGLEERREGDGACMMCSLRPRKLRFLSF